MGQVDPAGAGGPAGIKQGRGKAALPRRREQLCARFGESSPGEGGAAQRWEGNRAACRTALRVEDRRGLPAAEEKTTVWAGAEEGGH